MNCSDNILLLHRVGHTLSEQLGFHELLSSLPTYPAGKDVVVECKCQNSGPGASSQRVKQNYLGFTFTALVYFCMILHTVAVYKN